MADENDDNYLSGRFKLSGHQLGDRWRELKIFSRYALWVIVTLLGVNQYQPFLPTRNNDTLKTMAIQLTDQNAKIAAQQTEIDKQKTELNEVRQDQINCLVEQKIMTKSYREQRRLDQKIEGIKVKLKPIGANLIPLANDYGYEFGHRSN